jgi:hypothetical protein
MWLLGAALVGFMRLLDLSSLLPLALAACEVDVAPPGSTDVAPIDPGHRPLRRVNRAELDRMFRDLTGTALRPGAEFPPDDAASGFDNHADALAVSPLFFELAEAAAGAVARDLLDAGRVVPAITASEGAAWTAEGDGPNGADGAAFAFYGRGAASWTPGLAHAGAYDLTVQARTTPGDGGPALLELAVGGVAVDTLALDGAEASATVRVELAPGEPLTLRFLNDAWDPSIGLDRNVWLDVASVEGPIDAPAPIPPERAAFLPCTVVGSDDAAARACAARIVVDMATRSWRRPLEPGDADALLARWDAVRAEGGSAYDATQLVLKRVWTSPRFLFLVEPAPGPEAAPVDAHTLAQRLAIVLWSSVPDEALRAAADDGSLLDPAVIEAQTRRMVADPRSRALVEDLAGQWLGIRLVARAAPDPNLFPTFTESIRAAMAAEMEDNFAALLDDEVPFTALLTDEWSRVTDPLLDWYGLESRFSADGPRTVRVAGAGRGGWLAQGGLLTALSPPTRTSPVKRGVWTLTQILCDEPPPPPPNVEGLPEASASAATVRERLEEHRANVACAACHDRIDPVGLAFEGFDAVGRVRTEDAGAPIDATGTLPDGTTFDGLAELQAMLATDPRLPACAAERIFTYAHGRDPRLSDRPTLEATVRAYEAMGGSLVDLLVATTTSEAFRAARAEEAP